MTSLFEGLSHEELMSLDYATWRKEFSSYLWNIRHSYHPWRYTGHCLSGWVQRAGRHLWARLHRQRSRFFFVIADVGAMLYGHPDYEPWDLSEYLPRLQETRKP